MSLSQRVKSIRVKQQMTQAEFAKSTGIKQSSICDSEKGNSKPSIDTVISISKEYGVTTDWILLGEE